MRILLVLLFVLAVPVRAGDAPGPTQVDWIASWSEAFALAKRTGRPVMICINSKDGEAANERAAQGLYHDPWFVGLSRRFVMVVISTRDHAEEGICPRFSRVTCDQHLECWKELKAAHGDRFMIPGSGGEMISPQHAWFQPDGTFLDRQEYELFLGALLRRMRKALEHSENRERDAPLDAADRAALDRARQGDAEARWAALGLLFASGKTAVQQALAELIADTKDDAVRRDLLKGLGRCPLPAARKSVEALLGSKEEGMRSRAAVCLEQVAARESCKALLKHLRTEKDETVRKNLCRALGACGGPAADKAAARALLKALKDDREPVVRKHAALALRRFEGAGSKLVCRKLERIVLDTKEREVRLACVYALAYTGNGKTAAVLEKLVGAKDGPRDKWADALVSSAIAKLKGSKEPVQGGWLFWEDRQDPARKD